MSDFKAPKPPPMSEAQLQAAVIDLAHVAEVAWAAGLFEGEGSLSIPKRARYATASLSMTDEDVVLRFARIVGSGQVHTVLPRQPHYLTQYRWSIQGAREIRALVTLFMPYLGKRRAAKAWAVLAAIESVGLPWRERETCARHHPLLGDNLVERRRRDGITIRSCRTCKRETNKLAMRAWRARQRERG